MSTVLITGGAGFIGSALTIHWVNTHASDRVVVFDPLTSPGHKHSLDGLDPTRFRFVQGDICDRSQVDAVISDEKPDLLLHLAAESHVDRSILGPAAFIQTNVMGTQVLLESARAHKTPRFVLISTDE